MSLGGRDAEMTFGIGKIAYSKFIPSKNLPLNRLAKRLTALIPLTRLILVRARLTGTDDEKT